MRALKIVFAAVLVAVAVTAGFVVVALLAGVAILFLAGRALVVRLRGSAAGPSAPRAANPPPAARSSTSRRPRCRTTGCAEPAAGPCRDAAVLRRNDAGECDSRA